MSNIITVPHTIQFLAEINLDTIPANLIPALVSLSEEQLTDMVKQSTISAIGMADLLGVANDGAAGWAYLRLAE
jgi:hypothetical protein